MKFPSYGEPLPPSGVNNEGETMSEDELNLEIYTWKKEMEIIYDAKITIRPIYAGPTEWPSGSAQKHFDPNLRPKIDM